MDTHLFKKLISYLIYTLVALIPLTHKEMFSIIDPDLVWSKFVLGLIALLGLFLVSKDLKKYVKDPFIIFLGLIVAFQIVSLFYTKNFMDTLRIIMFQSAVFFSYPVFRSWIRSKKGNILSLVDAYLAVFGGVLVFLIYQIYLQGNFQVATGGVWPVPEYPTRYGSTFWDINHFGAYLSSLFFLLLGGILSFKKRYIKRVLYLFGLIGALTALYLTSSRSATSGFSFGLVVFVFLIFKSRYKSRKINFPSWGFGMVGITITVVPLAIIWVFANKIRTAFLYRAVSFFSHLFLLKVGVQIGMQNFLFGIGANAFHAYFKESKWVDTYYYIDKSALNFKLPLHNIWLETFTETGVFSFIIFLLFWTFLIGMLYRRFASNKDYLALGFLSGIISFLVGGFFYSYKSEFFWIYVVIASAYVFHHQFSRIKTLDFKRVFQMVFGKNFNIINIWLVGLSIVALVIPLLYVTYPLLPRELEIFYASEHSNLIIALYQKLLNLFRYVFGNYSFTGRALSLVFYFPSVLLLIGILCKRHSVVESLTLTAIAVHILGIFRPTVEISANWYLTFLFLVVLHTISLVFRRNAMYKFLNIKLSQSIYSLLLIVVMFVSSYSTYRMYTGAYDSDLSFITELAANRSLLNNTRIYISDEKFISLVHFYSDHLERGERGFYLTQSDVEVLSNKRFNSGRDQVFIVTKDKVVDIVNRFPKESKYNRIQQGNYVLIVYESESTRP